MIHAIIIDPTGYIKRLDHRPTPEEINEAVGGYFEVVSLPFEQIGWVNEDGSRLGLPANDRVYQLTGRMIQGSMVVTGPADDEGETLPIFGRWVQEPNR